MQNEFDWTVERVRLTTGKGPTMCEGLLEGTGIGLRQNIGRMNCCGRQRNFLRRSYGSLLIVAGLTGNRSTPETLTTACHAASWLSRSWRCGWRCTSIGPENFPLAEAKNCPETSVPNFDAWIYRPAAVSGV